MNYLTTLRDLFGCKNDVLTLEKALSADEVSLEAFEWEATNPLVAATQKKTLLHKTSPVIAEVIFRSKSIHGAFPDRVTCSTNVYQTTQANASGCMLVFEWNGPQTSGLNLVTNSSKLVHNFTSEGYVESNVPSQTEHLLTLIAAGMGDYPANVNSCSPVFRLVTPVNISVVSGG